MAESPKVPLALFVCTGNSARSQMAEALLRHHAGDRFDAHSAGTEPKGVHPLTLRVLAEMGIDTSTLRSKSTMDYLGKVNVQYAIVVCDRAQQSCPRLFPFTYRTLFWPFDDPAAAEGSEEERLAEFRRVRDQIDEKIQEWIGSTG